MEFDDGMYIDETFLPEASSLFKESKKEHAEEILKTVTRWCRPYQVAPHPTLFGESAELCLGGGMINMGVFNNSSFIGAVSVVSENDGEFIYSLLVSDEYEWLTSGSITWRFFFRGEWHEITVDTLLPCTDETSDFGYPVLASSSFGDINVMWLPLLEKAYSKLCGTYGNTENGVLSDSMVDLTGGCAQDIFLTEERVSQLTFEGLLWERICRYDDYGYLISASFDVGESGIEESRSNGIIPNRCYSLVQIKEVENLKFVLLRNIWGGILWNGDWSAKSKKWSIYPDIEIALRDDPDVPLHRSGEDGTFWMVWQDFKKYFNKIHICRVFDEEYNQYSIQGSWEGKTAAGDISDDYIEASGFDVDTGEFKKALVDEKKSAGNSFVRGVVDSDISPSWFNNPQYRLSVSEDSNCFISLSQYEGGDGETSSKCAGSNSNYAIGFSIIQQKRSKKDRIWKYSYDEVLVHASDNVFFTELPLREVSKGNIELDPKFVYYIVPYTKSPNVEMNYILRVFTTSEMSLEPLPETLTYAVEGGWMYNKSEWDTAGGALVTKSKSSNNTVNGTTSSKSKYLDNCYWYQNNQYILTLAPEVPPSVPVNAVIVVKRTGKTTKRDRESMNHVGIVVTKLHSSATGHPNRKKIGTRINAFGQRISSPKSTLKKHKKDGQTNAGHGRNTTKTTNTNTIGSGFDSNGILSRKLEIVPGEWMISSEYRNVDVSSTLLQIPNAEWLEGDYLVVVPSLTHPGTEGKFQLEVHSDFPLQLKEIPRSTGQTITSEWSDGVAGGCHLNESTFRRNPAFRLTMKEAGVVKITLSRPHRPWKKPCLKDSVGCMIGFYITNGDKIDRSNPGVYHDGKQWSGTTFVPMNEISSPELYLEPSLDSQYIIVPTTYEPKRKGSFFLSAQSDAKFSLQKLR